MLLDLSPGDWQAPMHHQDRHLHESQQVEVHATLKSHCYLKAFENLEDKKCECNGQACKCLSNKVLNSMWVLDKIGKEIDKKLLQGDTIIYFIVMLNLACQPKGIFDA